MILCICMQISYAIFLVSIYQYIAVQLIDIICRELIESGVQHKKTYKQNDIGPTSVVNIFKLPMNKQT